MLRSAGASHARSVRRQRGATLFHNACQRSASSADFSACQFCGKLCSRTGDCVAVLASAAIICALPSVVPTVLRVVRNLPPRRCMAGMMARDYRLLMECSVAFCDSSRDARIASASWRNAFASCSSSQHHAISRSLRDRLNSRVLRSCVMLPVLRGQLLSGCKRVRVGGSVDIRTSDRRRGTHTAVRRAGIARKNLNEMHLRCAQRAPVFRRIDRQKSSRFRFR